MNRGKNILKAVLLMIASFVIILSAGIAGNGKVSAKASDFTMDGNVLIKYQGSDKKITIPDGVVIIGKGAFKNCMLEQVTIPDSVRTIEETAFQYCSKLTEIVIPEGVWDLGESAFQGCSRLNRVQLSSNLYVGPSSFKDCTSLKELIIPDGVNTLGFYAFMNCSSLELVDLPESINFIGASCFENCINLDTILFPTQDPFFGHRAFYNTPWLDNYEGDNVIVNHTLILYRGNETDITIPKGITIIGYGAYERCTFIKNVTIPVGVIEIGNSAFEGCSGLTEIILPDSVTRVGSYTFNACSNLTKITIPGNVNIRRDALEGTKWMKDYPGDFVILNGNLIAYRGTASKVVIPDNITAICTEAFSQNYSVTEVTVPKSITMIYYAGFFICNNLQKVFIMGKNTKIDYDAFVNCSSDLIIYGTKGGAAELYADTYNIKFESYGLNRSKVTLYVDGDNTITLKVSGFDGDVEWKSEDLAIAKVSNSGKLTAVNTGTTKITAKVNGNLLTCEVTVKSPFINKNSVTIMVGRTSRLNIIGISSGITWSSSNKSVAAINSSGVITAVKKGTATITGSVNGKQYTCKVTVN